MTKRLVRFGLMCKGNWLRAWQGLCLRQLLATEKVEMSLRIIEDATPAPKPSTSANGLISKQALYLFYARRLAGLRSNHMIDMSAHLVNVPALSCQVKYQDQHSQIFSAADVQAVKDYGLDFLLRFGFNIIRGEMLHAARYGIWSFHHADEERYRGLPPCFWEIYNDDAVTGAILQRLTERLDGGLILRKGFFKTVGRSYAENRDQVCFDTALWPAQVCIDIQNGCADYADAAPSKTVAPIRRNPDNGQTLRFAWKLTKNRIHSSYQRNVRRTEWNVGIVRRPIQDFLKPNFQAEIDWLPRPRLREYLADPFGLRLGQDLHILCEEYSYKTGKGTIVHIELREGNISGAEGIKRPAINLPVHMSYPFLFQHDARIYCVPETHEANEISLYEARSFPQDWVKVATLVPNIAGLDPTVFSHAGLWWLTCTDYGYNQNVHLFIYYARALKGPWLPHKNNPVKSDVRSSRPAGTPFLFDDCLFRPAQDCSCTYGGQVVINRVLKLSPDEFREEPAAAVAPASDTLYREGLHTLSAVGDITLVDSKRYYTEGGPLRTASRTLINVLK
jgi:hypothetical protein